MLSKLLLLFLGVSYPAGNAICAAVGFNALWNGKEFTWLSTQIGEILILWQLLSSSNSPDVEFRGLVVLSSVFCCFHFVVLTVAC